MFSVIFEVTKNRLRVEFAAHLPTVLVTALLATLVQTVTPLN